MKKVSGMVVDVNFPFTFEEKSNYEYACIKNRNNQVVLKQGSPSEDVQSLFFCKNISFLSRMPHGVLCINFLTYIGELKHRK
jgi:hypothetical protein